MLNERESILLTNQLSNQADTIYQNRLAYEIEKAEYNLFNLLKPKLSIDGDQYCVLYGENLQEGIAGFGDSPYKAILDFNRRWNKSLKEK